MENSETTNRFGIEKIEVMQKLIPILTMEEPNEEFMNANLYMLGAFLTQKLMRVLTQKEHLNLLEGLRNFFGSDEGTNERIVAIDYLLNLDFIE